ncbi:unnamed protein product [Paramecium sonneborni]|uniref:Tim44-like domain-containing protein n=1 Tax=Paramecium sonneborni TaxID=65129 RepID=A0A8S1RM14_9CILI|nr:unnamed protein product [Paramecium sonneborni]
MKVMLQEQQNKFDPNFDLYELENEAKVILEQIYNLYLVGDLESLQKVCREAAIGYFKVFLKKLEAEVFQFDILIQKSEPNHKQLWNVDEIRFTRASIPDSVKLPALIFTILVDIILFIYKNRLIDLKQQMEMMRESYSWITNLLQLHIQILNLGIQQNIIILIKKSQQYEWFRLLFYVIKFQMKFNQVYRLQFITGKKEQKLISNNCKMKKKNQKALLNKFIQIQIILLFNNKLNIQLFEQEDETLGFPKIIEIMECNNWIYETKIIGKERKTKCYI